MSPGCFTHNVISAMRVKHNNIQTELLFVKFMYRRKTPTKPWKFWCLNITLCNFPQCRNSFFRNLSCYLTETVSSVSSSSHPLSDAGANPLWGGKNNEHRDGGTVLWSSHNVGLQLKHCGIDAALSSGWMSADKRVKASTFQPWELLEGAMMASFLVSRLLERTD